MNINTIPLAPNYRGTPEVITYPSPPPHLIENKHNIAMRKWRSKTSNSLNIFLIDFLYRCKSGIV